MAAHGVWVLYAGEIASDLSQYHHRRIADWHTGSMSSFELLELLEFMPDAGRFKTALRGGEPSDDQWAWRQAANEAAVLRLGMLPGSEASEWGSRLFMPASYGREAEQNEADSEEIRGDLFAMIEQRQD
jgi:hypothetical protein